MTQEKHASIDTIVVGLGLTGMSCSRFLQAQDVAFAINDSRDLPPNLENAKHAFPESPIYCGELNRDVILSAKTCVVSPGISIQKGVLKEAVEQGVEVIGDIELFARHCKKPVIAITGANGKSTVTTLVYEMAKAAGLKVRAGGNLGTPALDLLSGDEADLYVLELSSFQLETTHSLNARAATVLNISEDHMDRYDDLAAYAQAKARIFHGDGMMILNADDAVVQNMAREDRNIQRFSLTDHAAPFSVSHEQGNDYLMIEGKTLLSVSEMKIQGRHNVANALAAVALAQAADIKTSAMVEVLKNWPGLPHRCAWVAEHQGVRWYNDSKGTNEGATVAAIEGFADRGPIILIAGGDAKGAEFETLASVAQGVVKHAVLIGQDADRIAHVLKPVCAITHVKTMREAVKHAAAIAEQGDQVLMSPACASLDMYPNYLARGEDFVQAVHDEVVL